MNFLLANFFQSSEFLMVVLLVAIAFLALSSIMSRRKMMALREELETKLVKGAKVRTQFLVYGVVVSTRKTTDGTIVLIETGEGDKKSYFEFNSVAIADIDSSEEVVIDLEGNEVPLSELNKSEDEEVKVEETKTEAVAEEVVEEVKEAEIAEAVETVEE